MLLSKKRITRYLERKEEAPVCLLPMRVGAFLQVMGGFSRTLLNRTLSGHRSGAPNAPLEILMDPQT